MRTTIIGIIPELLQGSTPSLPVKHQHPGSDPLIGPNLRVHIWLFPKMGPLFGSPYNKMHSILASIWGALFLFLVNSHICFIYPLQ